MRAAAIIVLVLAACGGHPVPAVQKGVLVIHCAVPDAEVVVDDIPVATIAELPGGLRLPAGQHRVELRHDRYHTRYLMVTVAPGPAQTVEVALAEALPVKPAVTLRRGFTIPNALTVVRIVAAPVFGWLWARGQTVALWVFLATVATDFLDGFLARVLDQRSRLGAILDPLADKLLNLVALVVGMWLGVVPVWWACVIFGREAVVGVGVILGATRYRDKHGPASWQPSRLGKYAMLWQSVAVTLIVIGSTLAPAGIEAYAETAILMTALLTLISGAQYVIRASQAVWGKS